MARGESKQFLAFMESQAAAAERNAASNSPSERHWREAASFYNIGSLAALRLGQFQKGINHGLKGLEIAERVNAPGLQAQALYYIGKNYTALGQRAKAKEFMMRALEMAKQISDSSFRQLWEANIYQWLSTDYQRRGDVQKAVEYRLHALQLQEARLADLTARPKGNPNVIAEAQNAVVVSLSGLASVQHSAGNTDEAVKLYERAIHIIKDTGIKTQEDVSLYRGLGAIYLRKKDFSRAQEMLEKSLQLAEEKNLRDRFHTVSASLGDLFFQTQRPAEAIPHYKRAIEVIESNRSLLESAELRSSFFEDKQRIYSQMIAAQLRARNTLEAFNYTERARARAFLDVLGSKVQLARRGTLLEHERALQARISVLRAMLEGEEGVSTQTPELRKELAEARQAYNDYLTKVRKENKEQASLLNVEPLTLKQVQELLDPDVTMLEYYVAQGSVWLWVVEKDRVRFVSISMARKDLVTKVTELRDTVYQPGEKERFNSFSQELHKVLIQPALPHIRGKELIIVPHDVLHYLPFQALVSPQGKYLIQDYPVYYLSSASLMQFTKEKRRAMGERVLVLGNPDLGDPAMNLRFAEREAREIQALHPQSTLLLKRDATEDKAKGLSPQNDIIHSATHAELSEDDPLSSAILLAKGDKEDGRLEVREIFGMDLKANLIVLSACETGLGKLSSGDELVGLTRAFIYAGTPSVVASLWNVEDSSTAALMASFYKNLKTMTKVEALRQAQLQLIRGEARSDLLARRGIGGVGKLGEVPEVKPVSSEPLSVSTSHPYFWAPFILVGDGK